MNLLLYIKIIIFLINKMKKKLKKIIKLINISKNSYPI